MFIFIIMFEFLHDIIYHIFILFLTILFIWFFKNLLHYKIL